jgi:predicted adenylyl cyclase CyaB
MRPASGSVVARVRVDGSGSTVTVKRRIQADRLREEVEFRVPDGLSARKALELLGLRQLAVVSKTRRHASLDAQTTVTCDDVDGLGVYLEIEVLGISETISRRLEEAVEHVAQVLTERGRRVTQGYDRLLLARQGAVSAAKLER